MKRFRNILFYADRPDGLQRGLDRAVDLSQRNGARLTVMDVTPRSGMSGYLQRSYGIDLDAHLQRQRLDELEALTRPYTDAGIPLYSKVATGTAFIEIIRAVQRNGHDLLIKMAQQDATAGARLLGSTDMHLLRKCPCPVWIDRAASTPGYRRVLAAVDPFDEAGELPRIILDLATSLAQRDGAALDIVHAWDMPGESMLRNGRGRIPRDELELLLKATSERHRQAMDQLLSDYGLTTGDERVHLVKGWPAATISRLAGDHAVDLIIMGTLGRVGIPGMFIGNTAEDVLRSTTTAVLAVKPPGFVSPVE